MDEINIEAESPATEDFGVWSVKGHSRHVVYSLIVLDQIWAAVMDGFHRLGRGGLEVGGVLYGGHRDDVTRILDWRPIACEHANGPGFELSEADHAQLERLLRESANDPELEGCEPVGWFHSHTRSGVFLSEADVALYERYFPSHRQVALVLRPSNQKPMAAGFFFREADGSIRTETSYLEFAVHPRRREEDRQEAEPPPAVDSEPAHPPAPASSPSAAVSSSPEPAEQRSPVSLTLGIGVSLLLLVAAVLYLVRTSPFGREPAVQSVGLQVRDEEGQMLVQWDRGSPAVADAERAELTISDGAAVREVVLDIGQLRRGNLTYVRTSEDIQFRLTVYRAGGALVEETARFIGPAAPASHSEKLQQAQRQRDQLETEARELRQELRVEAARVESLRDQIRILRNRLRVEEERRSRVSAP